MGIQVTLFEQEFQPFEVLQKQQAITPQIGAQSVFIGYMRDFREQYPVDKMTISHYSPMTERYLYTLAEQLTTQYRLLDLYVGHRIGEVYPTSPLVLIAAAASHRANAITATSELLEKLKQSAPFWKKEHHNHHSHWVSENTQNKIQ